MASLNTSGRELILKVVYYGPGLGGKTTTLQTVHDNAPAERRGKLVSLATPVDRTLFFDFLPLRLPPVRGLSIRLQLFTVPGQVYFNATRRLVLSGADAVVFVADSQPSRMDANIESLENLSENLLEHGRDLASVPHIICYNKRDLEGVVSIPEMEQALNPQGVSSFETIATTGVGIHESLAKITALAVASYEAQLRPSDHPREAPISHDLPRENSMQDAMNGEVETTASSMRPPPSLSGDRLGSYLANSPAIAEADDTDQGPQSALMAPPPSLEIQRDSPSTSDDLSQPSPREGGLSFAILFSPIERPIIEQIEASIVHGAFSDALAMCDVALTRLFMSISNLAGTEGNCPHEATIPPLLGLDGRRYLTMRSLAKRARQVGDISPRDVLECYAFLLDARAAASQWDATRVVIGASSNPPPGPSSMPPLPRFAKTPTR